MATGLYSGASGLSFGTGLYKNRLGLFSGASGLITGAGPIATLSLNFITGNVIDPRITFSRGTNATLIDSTGTLTYAPSNQVLNSESFTATSWTGVGTSGLSAVVSNAIVAPDGTTTADSLVEDALTSDHRINQSGMSGSANAGKYAFSVYLKAGTRTFARIQFDGTINAVGSSCGVNVNLLDGSFSTPTTAGNITSATATVTDVGNGWYRVGLLAALSTVYSFTGASVRIFTMQSLTGSTSFLGDGSNIFVWGAQFGAMTYETAPRAYNSTTPKNLLGYTEEFDNAAWTKTNLNATTPIIVNATTDPNGYLTADKIVVNNTSGTHTVGQNLTVVLGQVLTASAYVKAAEYNFGYVLLLTTFAAPQIFAIDLTTGEPTTTSGSPLAKSVTNAGNGWWRISITQRTNAAGTATMQIRPSPSGTTSGFTGDNTSGIYVWGAQLSDSASLDPYAYNPAAAPTSTAYYGPRFDYDPVTLAPLGLLIEEARTNLLLNSAILSTQNITTTAQAYTLSFYGTGTVTLSGTSTAGPLVGTGVFPNRVSLTFTPTAGTLTLTVSGTVSNAQLEAGGFATSYIPTAGASVTRSADIATMVGNNFTNWYNETNGTISVSTDTVAPNGANIPILSFQDAAGAATNRHQICFYTLCSATVFSGTVQANLGANTLQSLKSAYAYQDNNFGFSANGTTTVVDLSGTVPLSIGYATLGRWDYGAAPSLNGHLKTISYYNTRLTDAQLQAVSA